MQSSRLQFSKLSQTNANDNYLNWFEDQDIKNYIKSYKKKLTINNLKNYIILNNNKKDTLLFGIFYKKNKKHIGNIKFDDINVNENRVTMGVLIGDKNYRGIGVFSETIEYFSNYFYINYKITNILLGVDKKNSDAIRAYYNSNFKKVNIFYKKKQANTIYMVKKYNFLNKIIIGTAQFDKNYGINRKNKINKNFEKKIIETSLANKINYFDTSNSYSKYKNLFEKNKNQEIIFKILLKKDIYDYEKYIEELIKEYKILFKVNKFYAILIHNFEQLSEKDRGLVFKVLKKIKRKNITKKIGISIYSFEDLLNYVKKYKIEILQCPFSIFDRRLIDNSTAHKLKKMNVEIHVRSIFLQGILLNNSINNYFTKWKNFFIRYNNWILRKKIDKLQSSIYFVLNNNFVDKLVIGVDNFHQVKDLQKILNNYKYIKYPKFLQNNDLKLINPVNWK